MHRGQASGADASSDATPESLRVGQDRDYDLIVWGAYGFTGKLVCEHLLNTYEGSLKWAAAGRDVTKLQALSAKFASRFPTSKAIDVLVGDTKDAESMVEVAKKTKVLLSTAGPYAKCGTPVVKACIEARTHYADITGEVAWVAETVSRCHEEALRSGVKIVHCCGWDCIPADLGALLIAHHCKTTPHRGLARVTHIITELAGAFSGGSLDTALQFYAKPFQTLFPDPYSLNPPHQKIGKDQQQSIFVGYERVSGLFTSPSIFAPANLRIVRRSNALLDNMYGKDIRVDDVMGHSSLLRAAVATLSVIFWGLILLVTAQSAFLTKLLRAVSFKPGEGPSEEFMQSGSWKCLVTAETIPEAGERPARVVASLQGKGDPGYSQTSRMLLEAGVCLLKGDASDFCLQGGVLTPASALGMPLIARLRDAGMHFKILPPVSTKGSKEH